jgi:hypothetical protein
VPTGAPRHLPEAIHLRPRRVAITVALAAAVAIPATAFAGKLGDLLGISNGGMPVPSSSVLPADTKLDAAMQELKLGGTMQSLGTLNGVAFYATRNADGNFCFAMVRVDGQFGKGLGCDLNADNFPSANVQALTFPTLIRLQGVAADGVATVQAIDANGDVLDSTPVEKPASRLDDGHPGRSRSDDPHPLARREDHRDAATARAVQPTNKPDNATQPTNK